MLHGTGFFDIAATLADNDAEFNFPICLDRAARDPDLVIRTYNGGGPFVEDDRLGGTVAPVSAAWSA